MASAHGLSLFMRWTISASAAVSPAWKRRMSASSASAVGMVGNCPDLIGVGARAVFAARATFLSPLPVLVPVVAGSRQRRRHKDVERRVKLDQRCFPLEGH